MSSPFGARWRSRWLAYARVPVKLTPASRATLTALRVATLMLLIVILLRPVVMVPPAAANNSLLPILVDVSRSMRLTDDGGASASRTRQGDRPRSAGPASVRVPDRAADVWRDARGRHRRRSAGGRPRAAATSAARWPTSAERYRGRRGSPACIVLSDGGDTAPQEAEVGRAINAPIFTVGIGGTDAARDREVVNLTAGEPLLPDASIDLSVSATSAGFGTEPVELRVSANGRPVDVRRVTPAADGAPIHEVFTVSPIPTCRRSTPSRFPRRAASSRPRTTAAACWCRRRPARRKILIRRRRAGLRAHLPQARARPGSRPRRRCGGPQGPERRRARHVLRPGRRRRGWRRCRAGIRRSARSCSSTTP